VPDLAVALDASWHGRTFYHGAQGYHAPFLGWRGWYAPSLFGWKTRVATAIRSHFDTITRSEGPEKVWWDGADRPDLDHEGTQYHHLENSSGFLPALLHRNDIYDMQEVALDMTLHFLNLYPDLKLAGEIFDRIAQMLAWEERILDPDQDGLYQNFLNTWISDGHSYHGAGCAQASAYNYQANVMMAKLAAQFDYPVAIYKKRAEKIHKAMQDKLWMASKGLLAESIDTVGNKLLHPSPELSTLYLAIECGLTDMFQGYQMLRFTETELRQERTLNRQGRLVYSSNWYPKKYSTCGLFPAENMHLAWAYFQLGQKERGWEILNALVDCYFSGKNPGLVSHILTGHGGADNGDQDFSDVSSMYLRLIVEGLWGIRFYLLDHVVEIAPNLPADWTHGSMVLKDISVTYQREGRQETLQVFCAKECYKRIKLPLRSSCVEGVLLNHTLADYRIEAAVNGCFLVIETDLAGPLHLEIHHGREPLPTLRYAGKTLCGNTVEIETTGGEITGYQDPTGAFADAAICGTKLYAKVQDVSGPHTLFVGIRAGQYEAWLPADIIVAEKAVRPSPALTKKTAASFEPLDITEHFNVKMKDLHTLEYRSPRPKGYSIGVRLNGRYAWEWNHMGHNAVHIDDSALRQARGVFTSPSGIKFAIPTEGPDLACVSLWDNFPTTMQIPLKGKAAELALFFIGVTNAMQCWVENARLTVSYRDGSEETVSLIHPQNFDDWLVPALQSDNEAVYFSDYNHGIVQRIILNPQKDLSALTLQAVANEVILGLMAVSIRKE